MEYFRLRKKDDVFFCNVCVVEWCDSRDGGADDLGWEANGDLLMGSSADDETCGEDELPEITDLDELNILLKKPCFSLACGAAGVGGTRLESLVFSYPT
jgi:hypothetical protein